MKKFTTVGLIIFGLGSMRAQIPTGLPHPDRNDPIDLNNPADLIIYVLIPAAILLLYLVKFRKNGRLKWPGF